ncbi:MAG TPA: ferrous iron transport protein B, partial [Bacteroidales bacterium]|nr:ferrous iron transport protein B [Bacteroidales bacterium]
MTLADLTPGSKGIIVKVKGRGAFRKRILEMGFVAGKQVSMIQRAPLMDPVEYNVMGYNVSLRNSEARLIEIVTEKNHHEHTSKKASNISING